MPRLTKNTSIYHSEINMQSIKGKGNHNMLYTNIHHQKKYEKQKYAPKAKYQNAEEPS